MNIQNLLEKQAVLDSNINNTRERTVEDIRMSIIAEVVEFNEELEFSHKTWKSKEIDKKKQFEEFVDILFFILQELNLNEDITIGDLQYLIDLTSSCDPEDDFLSTYHLLHFIKEISWLNNEPDKILARYIELAKQLDYTNEQIEAEYNRKWKINMTRIGAEWR